MQEAREKMKSLQDVKFELIGHLQRNKVKDVVGNFYRIQTIDSIKLLERVATLAKDKSVKQKFLFRSMLAMIPQSLVFRWRVQNL